MSRYGKIAPGGRPVVVDDGYYLCARCGEVLRNGDRVVAVYRAPWWGIYSHPEGPDCPPKAVAGWRAVELALQMQESNVPTPRQAQPVAINGVVLPVVSLLDDTHCDVEKAAVTISQKDFLPTSLDSEVPEGDSRHDAAVSCGDQRRWDMWRNTELKIVEALDRGVVRALVIITLGVVRRERAYLYVKRSEPQSAICFSERDERPMRAMASLLQAPNTGAQRRKSSRKRPKSQRRSPVPRRAFDRDARGKSTEYPLYSQQRLTDGRRVLQFTIPPLGPQPLDEFAFYRLSGPRSQSTQVVFNSTSCPEMFDWSNEDVPKGLVKHWSRNPKTSPFGPVARLKPAFLAALQRSQ